MKKLLTLVAAACCAMWAMAETYTPVTTTNQTAYIKDFVFDIHATPSMKFYDDFAPTTPMQARYYHIVAWGVDNETHLYKVTGGSVSPRYTYGKYNGTTFTSTRLKNASNKEINVTTGSQEGNILGGNSIVNLSEILEAATAAGYKKILVGVYGRYVVAPGAEVTDYNASAPADFESHALCSYSEYEIPDGPFAITIQGPMKFQVNWTNFSTGASERIGYISHTTPMYENDTIFVDYDPNTATSLSLMISGTMYTRGTKNGKTFLTNFGEDMTIDAAENKPHTPGSTVATHTITWYGPLKYRLIKGSQKIGWSNQGYISVSQNLTYYDTLYVRSYTGTEQPPMIASGTKFQQGVTQDGITYFTHFEEDLQLYAASTNVLSMNHNEKNDIFTIKTTNEDEEYLFVVMKKSQYQSIASDFSINSLNNVAQSVWNNEATHDYVTSRNNMLNPARYTYPVGSSYSNGDYVAVAFPINSVAGKVIGTAVYSEYTHSTIVPDTVTWHLSSIVAQKTTTNWYKIETGIIEEPGYKLELLIDPSVYSQAGTYSLSNKVAQARFFADEPVSLLFEFTEFNIDFTKVGTNPQFTATGMANNNTYYRLTTEAPTGIHDIMSTEKATKTIRNGQLLIERDGKTYNLMGQKQ